MLDKTICLDIGGSAGYVAKALSPFVDKVFVIDIDEHALEFGKKNNHAKNIVYKTGDAMKLDFKDKSIDIIICNQVYEHIPNHKQLIKEIYRVLKDNGICYFGGNNRFIIMEPHYRLPFLSWFPKKLANIYIKKARNLDYYYESHLSYVDLKKLFRSFVIDDYTVPIIKTPEKFSADDLVKKNSIPSRLPKAFLKLIEPCIPGYVFILYKKSL